MNEIEIRRPQIDDVEEPESVFQNRSRGYFC